MNEPMGTYYSGEVLARRLRAEGEAVAAFFQFLNPLQWEQEVYGGGERWRVREILAHFIASERAFQELIEQVAAGGPGAPEGFDIDKFNRGVTAGGEQGDSQVLLGEFAMVRERTVAIVSALTGEQLSLEGRHPFLGHARVEEMVRNIYHHNSLHLRDIRAALRGAPQSDGAAALRGPAVEARGGSSSTGDGDSA